MDLNVKNILFIFLFFLIFFYLFLHGFIISFLGKDFEFLDLPSLYENPKLFFIELKKDIENLFL
jgi:hypothetical protein